MSNNLETGNHVLCIDDYFAPMIKTLMKQRPVKGQSYVIRDVLLGVIHPERVGDVRVLLIGVVNDSPNGKALCERGFRSSRFRKLDELKNQDAERASGVKEQTKELAEV